MELTKHSNLPKYENNSHLFVLQIKGLHLAPWTGFSVEKHESLCEKDKRVSCQTLQQPEEDTLSEHTLHHGLL